MDLFKSLRLTRSETGVSQTFPVTHLNSPTIFETKEGLVGSTIQVQGIPFVTADNDSLNQLSKCLHHAISLLDDSFLLYVTVHRKKEDVSLKGEFKSTFSQTVDYKYHQRFQGKAMYRNDIYLTVMLKNGDSSSLKGRALSFIKRLFAENVTKDLGAQREEKCSELSMKVTQLLSLLSSFNPRLLGDDDKAAQKSELISFLSLVPNGSEPIGIKGDGRFHPIANAIPQGLKDEAIYPNGALGQYITDKRLFVGDYIQYAGPNKSSNKFGVVLSIKKYPTETTCLSLAPLLEIDCEFIATHSFAPESRDVALGLIDKRRSKLVSSEYKGESQIDALRELEDEVSSEELLVGYHHNTVQLLALSTEELETAITETVKAYSMVGATVVRETIGLETAFFAQIPGNHRLIARSSLITSKNFVDFCSLHNYQTGYRDDNHLGSAVTLLETPSKTPVFMNFHIKGSKDDPSNGMTLLLGATGAGKSTAANLLCAQLNRYKGRRFFIERDKTSKIFVLADGGRYLTIKPSEADTFSLNPFQMVDTKENRTFIKDWFAHLLLRAGEEVLPSDIAIHVSECVDYAFDCLAREYRCLSNVARLLPADFNRLSELRPWLKGEKGRSDGEHAWLFDNVDDSLFFDVDTFGFDVTYLMDSVKPHISTPVYMYLLHRMRQSMDGSRLTSFILDEAWQMLDSPYWSKALKEWLPTIRKNNGHFVFMTQSPKTILTSKVSAQLIDNNATMLLLPNPKAEKAVYMGPLGLNQEEFDIIKSSTPASRLLLYKQEKESIICKLDLSDLSDEIRVFSANASSNALLDTIMDEVGDKPDDWLPVFLERSAA
jgi:type IV secretion system protein VirB4